MVLASRPLYPGNEGADYGEDDNYGDSVVVFIRYVVCALRHGLRRGRYSFDCAVTVQVEGDGLSCVGTVGVAAMGVLLVYYERAGRAGAIAYCRNCLVSFLCRSLYRLV